MAKVIKVKKVSEELDKDHSLRTLASLCYYYPGYTLHLARQVPYKHVKIMLSQAKRLEAMELYNLTQIASAPHSKKGGGVKKLLTHYKKVISNG